MKKICCVATLDTTVETFMIPAMELFLKDGYEVTLIATMSEDFIRKYSDRYKCVNVTMRRGFSLKDFIFKPFEFYTIFRREKFDYVQYATTNASLYASVASYFARVPHRVCLMWGIAFISEIGLKRKIFKLLKKLPCIFSNHVSIPSRKNQKFGADEGLYPLKHSSVVGDGGTVGVDISEFDFSKREANKQLVLNEHPELRNKIVYGFLGRIWRDKGANELLEAFMSMDNKDCALLLIGAFDTARTPLRQDILERAQKYPNIIFQGFTKEVPKYLSAVDILVHPSYHEGFSMAIQQAMSMGCAIVTTDIPGPSEVIEVGKCGLAIPIMDSVALAEAMVKVKDESLRNSFVKAGLERVREKFTRGRMVQLTFENRLDIINGKYDD